MILLAFQNVHKWQRITLKILICPQIRLPVYFPQCIKHLLFIHLSRCFRTWMERGQVRWKGAKNRASTKALAPFVCYEARSPQLKILFLISQLLLGNFQQDLHNQNFLASFPYCNIIEALTTCILRCSFVVAIVIFNSRLHYIVQADLKLEISLTHCPSTGITGMHHHTTLFLLLMIPMEEAKQCR